LAELFCETVRAIGVAQYSPAQVEAWAPVPIDYERWQERLDGTPPFVAEVDGAIAGFLALTVQGHIEWAYTHKDQQRRGVASALYAHAEQIARDRGLTRLSVDASRIARAFFEKQGFEMIRRQEVIRGGETIENFAMEKALTSLEKSP
jgi:putative acetyltransferase